MKIFTFFILCTTATGFLFQPEVVVAEAVPSAPGISETSPNAYPGEARIRDVAFISRRDQTEQRYVVVFPEAFREGDRHDVLIALHGHGSDRWQFVKDPRDECRATRDVAAKYKMIFISPDYRAKTSWMGPAAEDDLVQIIGEVKEKYHAGKVYLCGGSMGGTASLTFAVLHPELIAGVASMNGTANLVEYENFQDAIQESYGGTKAEVPEEYKKRSAEFFPARLTMPVGITAGGRDDVVPAASVLRLVKSLDEMGRRVLLVYRETGGHETNYEDASTILEFVLNKQE
ncbi:MAG: alpha/beta fold hydrolase [Candidatus Hydrogenedentes bacterium]|nr:alpha/beta fold hydrolase [Candidatus Hydrogenedentota bacterium]